MPDFIERQIVRQPGPTNDERGGDAQSKDREIGRSPARAAAIWNAGTGWEHQADTHQYRECRQTTGERNRSGARGRVSKYLLGGCDSSHELIGGLVLRRPMW
jgi:hypothetical protein